MGQPMLSKQKVLFFLVFLMTGYSVDVHAEDRMFEDFEADPSIRWEFIADTVMGGVSTGKVEFAKEGTTTFARLTGTVSTKNRGGFIQFRRRLDAPLPDSVTGIRIVVRGNNQRYFLHLRTRGTLLPWQYYQSGFDAAAAWREVRLPLSSFEASGPLIRSRPAAASLTSIGIVAYGRDHDAQVDVREIGFY